MSTIMDLYVNLIGNDISLIAASKRSAAALNGVAASGMTTTGILKKMGAASALALTAIVGESVNLATKFQQEMELLSTQAQVPQANIKGLSDQVLNLAHSVGQTPEVLAQGLYHIASAGAPAKDWMTMLASAAKLTSMGMGNMEDSTQAVIGVMAALFPDIKNANDAMAILNTTAGIGDMRLSDLATSIGTGVLSSFKTAGLEMHDFSAGMATLTDNVTPPQVAATRLRMAIALLSGPSGVAVKALSAVGLSAKQADAAFKDEKYLSKFGVNMTQLSADLHKPNGLLTAILDLKAHLKASGLTATEQSAVITRAFGGARTAAGIELLLNESDRLQTKYKQLGTAAKRAKDANESWANQQKTFSQQLKDLRAGVEAMAIKLGTLFLPILTKLVTFMVSHQTAMKVFFTIIIIGLTLLTAAWIALSASMMANPVFWIVVGIIAAVAALAIGIYELVKHWKTVWGFIKRITMDVWNWLKSAWAATWGFIKGVAMTVWHFLVHQWNEAVSAFKDTVNVIKKYVIDPIVDFFTKMLIDPIIYAFHVFVGFWKMNWKVISAIFQFFWGFFSTIAKSIYKTFASVLGPAIKALVGWWKFGWNAISTALKFVWNSVLHPTITFLANILTWLWKQTVQGAQGAWALLKTIFGYIVKYGINPIVTAAKWLGKTWVNDVWHPLVAAVQWAWKMLKILWGYIQKYGIDPMIVGIKLLGKWWGDIWGGIKTAVSDVWGFIKPIFDKIIGSFDKIKSGISGIMNAPGKAGSSFAHFLGFADGGRVPGPAGKPHLAVVHGGEYVLSNDMQSGRAPMSGLSPVFAGAPSAASVHAGSRNSGIDHYTIVADGKALFDFMVQRSQRNKNRNTKTFLQ